MYSYADAELQPDVVQYRRVGMWTHTEAPAHGKPGDGSASVAVELSFHRTAPRRAGLIQVLVFNAAELYRVGAPAPTGSGRAFCCTSALHAKRFAGCEHVGKLVVSPPAEGAAPS